MNVDQKNIPLEVVVCAAQKGQQGAMRQLYDRFQRALMGYCLMSADGDRDLAKDLLQETFVRTFEHLHRLEHPERFSSWIWTIAHRVCAKQGGRRQRYDVILESFALEREVILEPSDKQARAHRIACVQDVLKGIDDAQLAQIVELKYTEPEHTTRQIAASLGIPHGTVTVSLMRFRKAIKTQLIKALAQSEGS